MELGLNLGLGTGGGLRLPPGAIAVIRDLGGVLTDTKGVSSGPVQPGRAYAGACTVVITGLLTTDTITADSTDKPTCTSNNILTIAADKTVYGVNIIRDGVVLGRYPCAEGAGRTCLNIISGGLPHGVISSVSAHTELADGSGFSLNVGGYSTRSNVIKYNTDLSQSVWIKRGTMVYEVVSSVAPPVARPSSPVILVSGIAAGYGVGDFYQEHTYGVAGDNYFIDMYIKRVSTSGIIKFEHASDSTKGKDQVNLANIGDDWVKLRDVASNLAEWKVSPAGKVGFLCHAEAGTVGTISFYLCAMHINLGTTEIDHTETGAFPIEGYQPARNAAVDAIENSLQYPGPIRQNLNASGYAATFSGTEYLAGSQITGNETIIDFGGTGTPSVSAGRVDVTAGSLEWVNIDGRVYVTQTAPDAEQVKFYNINGYNDFLTYTGGAGARCTTKMANPGNLRINGFNQSGSDYLPASNRINLPRFGNGYVMARNELSLMDEGGWTIQPTTANARNGSKTVRLLTVDSVTHVIATLVTPTGKKVGANDRITIFSYVASATVPSGTVLRTVVSNATGSVYASNWRDLSTYQSWGGDSYCILDISRSEFDVFSGWDWDVNTIDRISFELYGATGADIYLDCIAISPKARPKIVFTFDDTHESDYTEAYTYMISKSLLGTSFINTGSIGVAGSLSAAQVAEMYSSGWEICNHTRNHTQLVEANTAQRQQAVLECRDDLIALGCPDRAMYLAYPGGHHNEDVINDLQAIGVISARTTVQNLLSTAIGLSNPMRVPMAPLISAVTTAADVIEDIDNAISSGRSCILLMHGLVAAAPELYEFLISEFRAVVDYAAARRDDGLCDVVPYCQWFDESLETGISGVDCVTGVPLANGPGQSVLPCTISTPVSPELINAVLDFYSGGVPIERTWADLMAIESVRAVFGYTGAAIWSRDLSAYEVHRARRYFG